MGLYIVYAFLDLSYADVSLVPQHFRQLGVPQTANEQANTHSN